MGTTTGIARDRPGWQCLRRESNQPYANADGGAPGLRLNADAALVEATVSPTILMAPGQPESITEGVEESRGFHVKLQSEPVTAIRLKTVLTLEPPTSAR